MDYYELSRLLSSQGGGGAMLGGAPVPLPQPDPRGPPVSLGVSPDVSQPNPQQPSAQYGLSDHMLAALRAVFEGQQYRQQMAPYRDESGLYNRRR